MSFGDGPAKISDPALLSWFNNDSTNELYDSARSIHERTATQALLEQSQERDGQINPAWAQDLQQKRLAVREARFRNDDTAQDALPALNVNLQNREKTPAPEAQPGEPVGHKAPTADKAVETAPQLELTGLDERDRTLPPAQGQPSAAETGIASERQAFSQLEQLAGPESATSQKLRQMGLYDQFNAPNCLEHMSWRPDSLTKTFKTEQGYRRTMVVYFDGTTSEQATDPNGNKLYTQTRAGKLT